MTVSNAFFSKLFAPAADMQRTSWLFLRLLAVIYFTAFLSLSVQITGLAGPDGILPFGDLLTRLYQENGANAWWRLPNVFWISASNLALQSAAILGCAFSLLLLFGIWQRISLIALFVLYLSLYHAGQIFLNFQWDTLLLETGFLAIFLLGGPNRLVIFLFHFLLFRLRFMSGLSKLGTGDPSWSGLTALKHYFETQPLPHFGAWYFHHLPDWLLRFGAGFTFFTELVVPFFIFLPRPFRLAAAAITLFIQLLIIASSNHNFINLLTILLCLFLLDDKITARFTPKSIQPSKPTRLKGVILAGFGILIITSSLSLFYSMSTSRALPSWLNTMTVYTRTYGIGHIYHVFPTMQVERQELQIEGSHDGVNWQPYVFRYKPQDMSKMPQFIIPHQPRLDWMIWFVPPQRPSQKYWFEQFMNRLWEGSPEVLALLDYNPFKNQRPRYLRVMAYRYRFTTPKERKASGNWWVRELLGEFPHVPPRRP